MRFLPLLLIAVQPFMAPLPAQADTPGPAEQMLLAARLFAAGAEARDGLTQIAAARLAGAITLQPLDLKPEVSGGKAKAEPAALPDAAQMLEAARKAVEADETLGILLASTETTAEVLPKSSLRSLEAGLAPGQTHRYRLPADGGARVEIAVLSDMPVQLEVATETGLLCKTTELCRISLPESGFLSISLTNPGEGAASYRLLTN